MIADGVSGKAKDLKKVQSRSAMRSDKSLLNAFREIGILCDRITLPKLVADQARHYYRLADDAKLVRGKLNRAIIAACIYAACKVTGNGRSFKEISRLADVTVKDIGKCYRPLEKLIEDQLLKSTSSADLIARPCSVLGLGIDKQKLALAVVQKINELDCLRGRNPRTVAATAIYVVVS